MASPPWALQPTHLPLSSLSPKWQVLLLMVMVRVGVASSLGPLPQAVASTSHMHALLLRLGLPLLGVPSILGMQLPQVLQALHKLLLLQLLLLPEELAVELLQAL